MSSWFMQDSEVVADSLAANWGAWRGGEPANRLSVLFLRRVRWRSHLPAIAAVILTVTIALAGALDKVGVIAFPVDRAILGAALYRCAEFSRVGITSRLPVVVLLLHGIGTAAILWGIWGLSMPALGVAATMGAIAWTGFPGVAPRQLRPDDAGHRTRRKPPTGLIGLLLQGIVGTVALAVVLALWRCRSPCVARKVPCPAASARYRESPGAPAPAATINT